MLFAEMEISTWDPATSDVTLNNESVPEINPDCKYLMDLGRSLNLYGTPFNTALRFFGNICTFLIMSRPGFNKSSTFIYFRLLAIVDFDICLTKFTPGWTTTLTPTINTG